MDETDLPSSSVVRELILKGLNAPVVFKGFINKWKFLKWTMSDWNSIFGNRTLSFRVGHYNYNKGPQWERHCERDNVLFSDFLRWYSFVQSPLKMSDGAFSRHTPEDVWAYCDYKYMPSLFEETDNVLQDVDWGTLGFPERAGQKSTLWIGTTGANTPCHYDTYGSNLVAQIYGRKRWILFPPNQSSLLLPTRLPYEESSMYSRVDFSSQSIQQYDTLASSTPFVVTLEPGDVLFVPHHWWHYVENLELAVSINTWLELPEDNEERVSESLVKWLVAIASSQMETSLQWQILNPNENQLPQKHLSTLLHYVEMSLKQLCPSTHESAATSQESDMLLSADLQARGDLEHSMCSGNSAAVCHVASVSFAELCNMLHVDDVRPAKRLKLSADNDVPIVRAPVCGCLGFQKEVKQLSPQHEKLTLSIIRAFCDPQVIQLVKDIVVRENSDI